MRVQLDLVDLRRAVGALMRTGELIEIVKEKRTLVLKTASAEARLQLLASRDAEDWFILSTWEEDHEDYSEAVPTLIRAAGALTRDRETRMSPGWQSAVALYVHDGRPLAMVGDSIAVIEIHGPPGTIKTAAWDGAALIPAEIASLLSENVRIGMARHSLLLRREDETFDVALRATYLQGMYPYEPELAWGRLKEPEWRFSCPPTALKEALRGVSPMAGRGGTVAVQGRGNGLQMNVTDEYRRFEVRVPIKAPESDEVLLYVQRLRDLIHAIAEAETTDVLIGKHSIGVRAKVGEFSVRGVLARII